MSLNCYLCDKELEREADIFTVSVTFQSSVFHKDDTIIDTNLCLDCSEFAERVPTAFRTMVETKEKLKHKRLGERNEDFE